MDLLFGNEVGHAGELFFVHESVPNSEITDFRIDGMALMSLTLFSGPVSGGHHSNGCQRLQQEEGADILADTVVDVGVPALGLIFKWFPADKDVKRCFAFENGGKMTATMK